MLVASLPGNDNTGIIAEFVFDFPIVPQASAPIPHISLLEIKMKKV
jgi:hypothetical protein